MSEPSRIPAVLPYLFPVIGWLYVFIFHRANTLALFHLRQAVGLFLFLVGVIISWAVTAWVLAWIPYVGVLGMALFALVIAAYLFGFVAWVLGLIYALRKRIVPLPGFGRWANRLPIN